MSWVKANCITALSIAVFLCLVSISSANSENGGTPSQEGQARAEPSRKTPNDLLLFYKVAHETKNIEMYEEALHDLFRLEMDSENTRRQNLAPHEAWMGKDRAVVATRRMFEDIKAIHIDLIPITEWEPCIEFRTTKTGKRDSLHGLRITVDPLIQYHLDGLGGTDSVVEGSYTWFHITVVPDPRSPGSWVILRIKDEVEAH